MLELERFGMPERYYLKNVTFKEGALTVSDQNPATPIRFLYDTGTTKTFISDQVATLLNLHIQPGDFDCFASGDKLGYTLNEIIMKGPNGTYTVQNASVCWDESEIDSLSLYQVVIGSNLFDQVPVFVDGPRNRLGIGQPTTSAVTWVPLPRNCQN